MAAITYLMAIWAGVNPDPVALAQAAVPYTSIPVNTLRAILVFGTMSYLVPQGQVPVVLSISPSTRTFGSSADMTITGTGFLSGGATVTVAGLTLGENTDFSEDSTTQLTVIGARLSGIAVGTYDVTYTNINGTSTLHNALTVTCLIPVLTSILPATLSRSAPVDMTVLGCGFTNNTTDTFSFKKGVATQTLANNPLGILYTLVNSGQLTLSGSRVAFGVIPLGVYDVSYTNSNGTSNVLVGALTVVA